MNVVSNCSTTRERSVIKLSSFCGLRFRSRNPDPPPFLSTLWLEPAGEPFSGS